MKKKGGGLGVILLLALVGLSSGMQVPSLSSNQAVAWPSELVLGSALSSPEGAAATVAIGPAATASRDSVTQRAPLRSKVFSPETAVASKFDRAPLHGQRGVTVTAQTDPSFATKAVSFLDHLQGLGVDSVSVAVAFQQSTNGSSDPHLASYVPTPSEIQTFIDAAHQRGMSVMVRPLMDDSNIIAASQAPGGTPGQWRGTVLPTDPTTWFSTYYNSIILPYASLTGLDVFDVGSELATLAATYPDRWTNLITNLRSFRPAIRVTYSTVDWYALPGQQQPYPSFAPSLDVLGVDAYFPLNGVTNGYDVSQLVKAWQPALGKIAQLSAYYHKTVQFHEIGLASQCCTLTQPFLYTAGAAPNLPAQAAYYAAACQAIRPYHIGLYWWAYSSLDPLAAPASDNTFTPYGKPAEQEMARCYLGGY